MKKILTFWAIFMCLKAVAVAQPADCILSGTVTDKKSGETLVGVFVYFPELMSGIATDADGRYSIGKLPPKSLQLQVSYLGHKTIVTQVDPSVTPTMDFQLEENNAMISEAVVTGLTGKTLLKDSPVPISYVGEHKLHTAASSNVIDAISLQPGVSQITTGAGISKPVIRGLGFNRIAVVSDGVRQEGNQWGAEHGMEIDGNGVGSVEIIKGPASLMYGSDALAGVIIFNDNLSAPANHMRAGVSSEYQSNNGLAAYSVNFSGNKGGLVWGGRWSDKYAHDYRNAYDRYVVGSRFRERAAEGLFGLNREWGYNRLVLKYYETRPGIVEGERSDSYAYGAELPYQNVRHYKAVSNNSIFIGGGTLKAVLAYQQNRRQEFEDAPGVAALDFQLHTVNYDVSYSLAPWEKWKGTAGVNGMWQKSLNLGEETLIPAYRLFDAGFFATAAYKSGRWTVTGGGRVDFRDLNSFALEGKFDSFSRNFSALTASAGAVYAVRDNMNIRLNLARGFRAPNLSELASNGVHEGSVEYEIGSHGLSSEYSLQADAGWDYTSDVVSAQLSLFVNRIDNYIYTEKMAGVRTEGYDTYRYVQGDARLLGGEAGVDFHPVEPLHFQNSFSYVNAVRLDAQEDARYLPYTPAPKWVSDLQYDLIRDGRVLNNTYVSLQCECNFRQNHFYAFGGTETATPAYMLANISAGTDIRIHGHKVAELCFGCRNVFDQAYQCHLSRLKYLDVNPENGRRGIFNMGRNFFIKISISLDWLI